MAVAPDASSAQGWLAATFTGTEPAGTVVHIVAADGTEVASFTATKAFSSVVYSVRPDHQRRQPIRAGRRHRRRYVHRG